MNTKDFETVIEEQIEKCKEVLIGKAKEYAQDDDRLHNFKNAAGMMGCDPKEALAGMMAKHTISVYDMCRDGKDHTLVMWNEKITDHINYLLLLKAIVMEEKKKSSQKSGRLHYFVSTEHKVVKPGDKVEFDCGPTTKKTNSPKDVAYALDYCQQLEDLSECKECPYRQFRSHENYFGCVPNLMRDARDVIFSLADKKSEKEEKETGLDRWLTDPPKPGKPIFISDKTYPTEEVEKQAKEIVKTWDNFLKSLADKSTKEWAKKVADGLAMCCGAEYRCDLCEFHKHPVCDESCSYTLMTAAKNLIEQNILNSEEKND